MDFAQRRERPAILRRVPTQLNWSRIGAFATTIVLWAAIALVVKRVFL